jgi:SAM-dependent methyltransferase
MSDTIERFSNRVENYVKYRPSYPAELLKMFETEMNLRKSSVVADIGSGTGISAKMFLENGSPVFGVEPNAAMRGAAENFLKEFPNFRSVDGTAENTTLDDESVDFVVAAQAFHWFDHEEARAEFKRILRDKGFVALLWNERQLDTSDFLRGYERLLTKFGSDYETVRHDNIPDETLQNFFQTDYRRKSFLNVQSLDFTGLKGRLLSSSYMPTGDDENFALMVAELGRLFADYEKDSRIEILYTTNIYYARV